MAKTLQGARTEIESLGALLHDARNMVAAMGLYCDLLEEPGVLAAPFRHYAGELRLVAGASRRLIEGLVRLERDCNLHDSSRDVSSLLSGVSGGLALRPELQSERERSSGVLPALETHDAGQWEPVEDSSGTAASVFPLPMTLARSRQFQYQASEPVANLAHELLALRNLISALVGPAITVGLTIAGGHRSIALTLDDLTRVLVNLARNAADAMPTGGHIQIALREVESVPGKGLVVLTVADNGPGIPEAALEAVFFPGYTTHVSLNSHSLVTAVQKNPLESAGIDNGLEPDPSVADVAANRRFQEDGPVFGEHRGLGLAIVRDLVEAAGGEVWAANRAGRCWESSCENSWASSDGPLDEPAMLQLGRGTPRALDESPASDTIASDAAEFSHGAVFVVQIPWST